jgi:hypothetical protein
MRIQLMTVVLFVCMLGCASNKPAPPPEGIARATVTLAAPQASAQAALAPSAAQDPHPPPAQIAVDAVAEDEGSGWFTALSEDAFSPAELAADLRSYAPKLKVGSEGVFHADRVRVITAELDGQAPRETIVIAGPSNAIAYIFRPQPVAGHPWLLFGAIGTQLSLGPHDNEIELYPIKGTAQTLVGLVRSTDSGSDGRAAWRLELFATTGEVACTPKIGYVGGVTNVRFLPIRGQAGTLDSYALWRSKAALSQHPNDASQQVLEVGTDVVLGQVTLQRTNIDQLTLHTTQRLTRKVEAGCLALTQRFQRMQPTGTVPEAPNSKSPGGMDDDELAPLADMFAPLARAVRKGPGSPRKTWLLANAKFLFPGSALAAELGPASMP